MSKISYEISYEDIQNMIDDMVIEGIRPTSVPIGTGGGGGGVSKYNNYGSGTFILHKNQTPKNPIIYDDMDITNLSVEHRTILRRVFNKLKAAENDFDHPKNKYMLILLKRYEDNEFVYKLFQQFIRKGYVVGIHKNQLENLMICNRMNWRNDMQQYAPHIIDPNNVENCDVSMYHRSTYNYSTKRKLMLKEQKHLEIIF